MNTDDENVAEGGGDSTCMDSEAWADGMGDPVEIYNVDEQERDKLC